MLLFSLARASNQRWLMYANRLSAGIEDDPFVRAAVIFEKDPYKLLLDIRLPVELCNHVILKEGISECEVFCSVLRCYCGIFDNGVDIVVVLIDLYIPIPQPTICSIGMLIKISNTALLNSTSSSSSM